LNNQNILYISEVSALFSHVICVTIKSQSIAYSQSFLSCYAFSARKLTRLNIF
jgi:hypothetical protein